MIRPIDIAWAAGFIEGEGCISLPHNGLYIAASQVAREPLDKLYEIFGGKIIVEDPNKANWSPKYIWYASGRTAAQCMMTIYYFMTLKRQASIEAALARWKTHRARRMPGDTRCVKGHDLTLPDAIFHYKSGGRNGSAGTACRVCYNARRKTERRSSKKSKAIISSMSSRELP